MVENAPADGTFVEVLPRAQQRKLPDRIEAYVSRVEPRHCGSLLKDLAATKKSNNDDLVELSHLKSVRRIPKIHENKTNGEMYNFRSVKVESDPSVVGDATVDGNENKRRKTSDSTTELEVLLGAVGDLDISSSYLVDAVTMYGLHIEKRWLPGRPAESKQELQEWNAVWPTVYFHKQSQEYRLQESKLTKEEVVVMVDGMKGAIKDALLTREQAKESMKKHISNTNTPWQGAVIHCPRRRTVVARACNERLAQQQHSTIFPDIINPLCTPILLAIQGVSRIERNAAEGLGMDSASFQNGQYLCTGYDLYTTKEPTVFEAMALVHSRIRRVVFGVPDRQGGGVGGILEVHCLPNTNHKYRVFSCAPDTALRAQCDELQN